MDKNRRGKKLDKKFILENIKQPIILNKYETNIFLYNHEYSYLTSAKYFPESTGIY